MNAMEIAQKLAHLGATQDAVRAYILALHESNGEDPAAEMEAAAYILEFGQGEDYKVAYTYFRDLYNKGVFKDTILAIMDEAFYEPNVKLQKSRYEKNCKLLKKYPYIFRHDFLNFDDLSIRYFPFDDIGFVPYFVQEERFGDYINFKNQVITHNFFRNLEKPILAQDIFSQYELEYLNDNVRRSEWIGRENHIYLHYTDWAEFCASLCVLNLRQLLLDKKFIFLIEDEIGQYPIDFKQRFGIDYTKYLIKPVGIREVNRLIWHTQLSSHNGGDFFNEVFDGHPNLLAIDSIMMSSVEESIKEIQESFSNMSGLAEALKENTRWADPRLPKELFLLRNRTEKDILVALYMNAMILHSVPIHHESRITPAIFFQPHFPLIIYELHVNEKSGNTTLYSEVYEKIQNSSILHEFPYIKTFTPLRRFTTSYAATIRFMLNAHVNRNDEGKIKGIIPDEAVGRVLNRSFMIDWQNRLFKDSVLVRFEDGKLNPKATFTALAAFLDLPYTDSLTCCTEWGIPIDFKGFFRDGFDPVTVYNTYDEYADDNERCFVEYFLRDAYENYGYDFKWYDSQPMDEERLEKLITGFHKLDKYIRQSLRGRMANNIEITKTVKDDSGNTVTLKDREIEGFNEIQNNFAAAYIKQDGSEDKYMQNILSTRRHNAKILMRDLRFFNRNGQPLHMMQKLELDPELLEQPLYH